jgi:DNA-directed RNA polymerase beta subunit
VVVSQLVRSPGVYFTADEDAATGRKLFAAKLIPGRGAWLEFETSNKNLLSVKIDRWSRSGSQLSHYGRICRSRRRKARTSV